MHARTIKRRGRHAVSLAALRAVLGAVARNIRARGERARLAEFSRGYWE